MEWTNQKGKGQQGKFETSLRYNTLLEDRLVWKPLWRRNRQLVPAKLAVGSVALDGFNRNRHTKLLPKPVDTTLGVLRLDSIEGSRLPCWSTLLAIRTTVPGEKLQFSADYVGALRNQIEKRHGGTAVFMQGASGDLSINRGPHADHVAYGQALGDEVVQLAASLEPQVVPQPSLQVREERFRFESRCESQQSRDADRYSVAFFPELINNFAEEYADGIRPRLTVALLNGEIAFVEARASSSVSMHSGCGSGRESNSSSSWATAMATTSTSRRSKRSRKAVMELIAKSLRSRVGAGEQLMNTALIWLFEMQGKKLN